MKPRSSPETSPLGDVRWQRIESRLFEALDVEAAPPRVAAEPAPIWRRGLVVAVAAMLAVAACVAVAYGVRALSSVTALPVASHVVTATAGSRVLIGGAQIDVGPRSSATITGGDAQGIVVLLERGFVDCEVSPRGDRPSFVVQAAAVSVRVVGTRFSVARDGDAVDVEVQAGTVEVRDGAARTFLHPSDHWTNRALRPDATTGGSASAEAAPDAPNVVASSAAAQAAQLRTPPPSLADPSAKADKQRYLDALALERTDPDAALARYHALSQGDGAWRMNALFAAGRLEAELGRAEAARRSLDEYAKRFPHGPNAPDARLLLDRLR